MGISGTILGPYEAYTIFLLLQLQMTRAGYAGWPAPFNPLRISPRIKRGEQARQ
jgi:hypothetical protein